MLFNSLNFLVFLLSYTIFISTFPKEWKNISIIFSAFFYASWSLSFYFIIFGICILLNYFSKLLYKYGNKKYLYIPIFILLINLVFFKYTNDLIYFFLSFLNISDVEISIILPIGISFYTFQSISYIIDVNKKKIKPYNFLDLLFYISFFPQIIAGPIVRAKNFFQNYEPTVKIKKKRVKKALLLIFWGYFLKVSVADNLAIYVDKIYGSPNSFNSVSILFSSIFYSFQIYADFFAYSLIAIGICKFVNIDIPSNFNKPYFSNSIIDFWRRWHISLSSFLRDYLYIPLGGNRNGTFAVYRNVLITMIIGGIWHGSGLNFIFWGLGHGILIVLSKIIKIKFKIPALIKIIFIFFIVTLLWVPFRLDNIQDVILVYKSIFSKEIINFNEIYFKSVFIKCLLSISVLIFTDWFFTRRNTVKVLKNDYIFLSILAVLLFFISLFYADNSKAFIYFQF